MHLSENVHEQAKACAGVGSHSIASASGVLSGSLALAPVLLQSVWADRFCHSCKGDRMEQHPVEELDGVLLFISGPRCLVSVCDQPKVPGPCVAFQILHDTLLNPAEYAAG